VDSHHHLLMRPSPSTQSRPSGERALGVNDAVADIGEVPLQSIAKEYFVPMPMPHDAGRFATSSQDDAQSKNRQGEPAAPRKRRDKCGAHAATVKILAELSDVRMNAGNAFLAVHCCDY
jgi:hypothetical protein